MHDRLIRLSKYLAKYLRHAPHELGLTLQPGGWVPVDDLLAAARRHGFPISYDDLAECVETNDKQRFAFDVSGELIRANQGHSAPVDLQLDDREPPETLYHGTVERFLASILKEGLIRGKLLGAVIPLTLIVVAPTNKQLLDPALDKGSPLAQQLLPRWGRLHAIRTVLSAVAFVMFLILKC